MSLLQQLFAELRGYKEIILKVNQENTDAPTLSVRKNDTVITFTPQYNGVGSYYLIPSSDIDASKVSVTIKGIGNGTNSEIPEGSARAYFDQSGTGIVTRFVICSFDVAGDFADGVVSDSEIEIHIYA